MLFWSLSVFASVVFTPVIALPLTPYMRKPWSAYTSLTVFAMALTSFRNSAFWSCVSSISSAL